GLSRTGGGRRGRGAARRPLGSAVPAPPRSSQRAAPPGSARFESVAPLLAPRARCGRNLPFVALRARRARTFPLLAPRARFEQTLSTLRVALGGGGERQAEEADEALGVAGVVAGHVERREAQAMEGLRARARNCPGLAVEQLDGHLAVC